MPGLNLTPQQMQDALLAIAAANTAYGLNNGIPFQVDQPLRLLADKVGRKGYEALPVSSPEGYVIKEVFRDQLSGLDAYLAYDPNTHSAIVGIAGVNGIAKDRPGSKPDTMQVLVGTAGQTEAFFQQGVLEALRNLSVEGPGAAAFKVTIAPHSGGGGAADTLLVGMLAGLNSKNDNVVGWDLSGALQNTKYGDAPDPYARINGLDPSNVSVIRYDTTGSEFLLNWLGMGYNNSTYAQAIQNFVDNGTAINLISQFSNADGTPGLMDLVPRLLGRPIGNTFILTGKPGEYDGTAAEYLHSPEGFLVNWLKQNNSNLNAAVAGDHKPLSMETTAAVLGLFKDFGWNDNAATLPAGMAQVLLSAALSAPGETTKLVGALVEYLRPSLGETVSTAIGAVAEIVIKGAALTNPVGFVRAILTLFIGTKAANSLVGQPTGEDVFLSQLPNPAAGASRQIITAAQSGPLGQAVVIDTFSDRVVYRRQDGMNYTQNGNGDYVIKLSNGLGLEVKATGGGALFSETPNGRRTSVAFDANENPVFNAQGGWSLVRNDLGGTVITRDVQFDAVGPIISITTTTDLAGGLQDVKTDTNADGKADTRNIVDDIGNKLDLAKQADLLRAEQLINQLNERGALGQGFYYDFTQWNANTLVTDLGGGLNPGIGGSPFGGLGQGLSFDPIGAFYESRTGLNDNAASIAAKTPVLLDAANRGLTASELAARDANRDGALRGNELSGLNAWVDANENGVLDTGEISGLAALGFNEIRATDYATRTAGNSRFAQGVAATPGRTAEPGQPGRTDLTQAVPAGNYRYLRDNDPIYPAGGGFIRWQPTDVKINFRDLTSLVGTDGDDAFDARYYSQQANLFQLDKLVNFYGGNGNDQVGGSTRNDSIWGGIGNDSLFGYAGDDKLYGEEGNDWLLGQDGQDYLDGGVGNDTMAGGVGNDIINGGDGNDAMIGFTFSDDAKRTLAAGETDNDTLYGGRGDDLLNGDLGNDYLDGGDDNDALIGGAGNDTLFGGNGADELQGGDGADLLLGEAGDDRMFGQVGDDILWGGDGDDLLLGFTGTNESKQSLNPGESDNDRLFGGAGGDNIYGGLGDDTLDGGADNDLLSGDRGNDTLFGGTGNDELNGDDGNDQLMGESGEDRLFGGAGDDNLWGGDGDDVLLGFTASNDVKQTLAPGETDNDKLYGGAGNDLLRGGLGADQLYGETGEDELAGGEGNDALYGGTGDDRLFGQLGNDLLYGGDGDDILVGFTGANEVKQSLAAGETDDDWLYGGAGSDILLGGEGRDYLDGGAGADIMEGGKGDDTYIVNSVNDAILEKPGGGYDVVISSVNYLLNSDVEELRLIEGLNIHGTGNALDNRIIGNSRNNILDGVTGKDTMIGGAGDDIYYVDNAGDQVIELAGEGVDTVQSSISYTLSDPLENLVLLDFSRPEKGLVDGEPILVFGYPKLNELDYMQGDAVPDYEGTCALTAIANLLKQADRTASEGDVIKVAIDNQWAVTDPTKPAYERGGSNYRDQQNILNRFGMRNELLPGYNEAAIANLIRSGRGVILAVNAGVLWDDNAYTGNGAVNHVVTVTGVAYGEKNGELKGFYIADSGRAKVTDMTRYVSLEKFRSAANVASAYAIYTIEPIKLWNENINGTGNAFNNTLLGNRGNNLLSGMAGNDNIEAGDGQDVLIGGLGNDTLEGGAGNDEYRFNRGDGQDIITSNEGIDTLKFGAGILPGQVSASRINGQTVLRIDANNSITFSNDGPGKNAVDIIEFADGTRWNAIAGSIPFNAAPVGSVTMLGDQKVNQTLVATNTLRDADGIGSLRYQWQVSSDGRNWADLAGATASSYKLSATEAGKRVRVVTRYTDGHGVTESVVSDAGGVVVRGNTAPVVAFSPAAQRATEGKGFSFALPQGAITDADPGDTLTWRATLPNGAALPAWLKFDAATRTFSGTPGRANIGSTQIRITATDRAGLSAEVRFDLAVSAAPGLNLNGTAKNDYLKGAASNDTLNGAAGNDVLQALAGTDVLSDAVGNNLLDGGEGGDTLTAGNGNDFLIGGKGNDTLTTGTGRDIIAFNRGDGQDTVRASTGRDNTVSLGGGIRYADLALKKNANDLVLSTGAGEQITFQGWYASTNNRSVNLLQLVIEGTPDYNAKSTNKLNNKKIEQFNFDGLVGAFDKARSTNPALATLNLVQAMASFHTGGSDTAAMGGGLAYGYARSGNLSSLTAPLAQGLLGSAQFGASNQAVQTAAAGAAQRLL